MFSSVWLVGVAFFCWCAVIQTEGKKWILVDSLSAKEDPSTASRSLEPHCMDHVRNQDESDVDCGGKACPKCKNGKVCNEDCDCMTNTCKNGKCAEFESCDDNIKNQDETDVDCGGSQCPACEDSKTCIEHKDCNSGLCKKKKCVSIESCDDNIQNQDESDVDCGGIHCPRCEDWKKCKADCDCISDSCKNRTCSGAETCTDGIKNQDETDIDCGGDKCPKCEITHICDDDCDCHNSICRNNTCVPNCVPECQNNGICTIDKTCRCPQGFTGPSCEVQSVGLCHDNDTLGVEPILLITFENGQPQYSTAKPSKYNFTTTYKQRFEPVTNDGMFSFINAIHNDFHHTWHTNALDHTEDNGGYMLLVNADYRPGEFYKGQVDNLCIGLRYEFSVYLANICRPLDRIKPNVRFEVRSPATGNQLLAQLRSGEIPVQNELTWHKYGLSFITPSSSVVLLMISDALGGMGNDIVIDDIALRVCSHDGSGFCPGE